MNLRIEVCIFIKKMLKIDNLFEAVIPNILTFPLLYHKTAPSFLSQSRKLQGVLKVSVTTLIAYFSDVCDYFRISFYVLNHLGGGFCLT